MVLLNLALKFWAIGEYGSDKRRILKLNCLSIFLLFLSMHSHKERIACPLTLEKVDRYRSPVCPNNKPAEVGLRVTKSCRILAHSLFG